MAEEKGLESKSEESQGVLLSEKLGPCSRLCGLSGRERVGDGLGGEAFSEEPGRWGEESPQHAVG